MEETTISIILFLTVHPLPPAREKERSKPGPELLGGGGKTPVAWKPGASEKLDHGEIPRERCLGQASSEVGELHME